jgi:hypothetical protein
VVFKAGKNQGGYFTNENVLAQVEVAMNIIDKYYPNDKHIFIFDNTTTHTM